MSDSITNNLKGTSSALPSTAPSEQLIEQLRALPADSRENVLTSLAEKRPGFVNRIRQILAQAPAADPATDEQSEQETATAKAQATAASMGFDPMQWMQGAQGLSLLDFLRPAGVQPPPSPDDASQATDDFQSQTALSSYMSNKFTL
jgi:hypothetical protein